MKNFFSNILISLPFVIGIQTLNSCSKDTDTIIKSKPEIAINASIPSLTTRTICGTTTNKVWVTSPNNSIQLNLHLKGSNPLSQMKISIHENADCHEHDERPLSEWEYQEILNFNSSDTTLIYYIHIPETAPLAQYHCSMELIDIQGLESEHLEYHIIVE